MKKPNHTSFPFRVAAFIGLAVVARLGMAGPADLDLTFGSSGKVNASGGFAYSVVVQPDGKILLTGTSLIRLNANGTLDSSFGVAGRATMSITSSSDQGNSVAVQTDGKIVTVGYSNGSLAVARFNPNGSRDVTFGGSGLVMTPIGRLSRGSGVAVQADGKIVVAGSATFDNLSTNCAIVRYNSNGNLDTSFGTGGKVTTVASYGTSTARSVVLQADGKIMVSGLTIEGHTGALVRYHTNGTLDATFGNGGIVSISGPSRSLAVQADGKIVVAGQTGTDPNYHFSLWRYDADGKPDVSFGVGGQRVIVVSGHYDDAHVVAIQADGKIVAAGFADLAYSSDPDNYAFLVARYNPNGNLDNTFHGTGKVTTDLGTNEDRCFGMALQTDGKIVAAGYTSTGMAVVRYQGDAVMPFAAWKLAHLGQANPPDLGDPDGDGLSTLAEYGLGFFPEAPNTAPVATPFDYAEGRRLRMFVPRDPTHSDVTVEVQAAGDLAGPWATVAASALGAPFAGPGYVGGDEATPGVKTVEVRDVVNGGDAGQRFMRVRVMH